MSECERMIDVDALIDGEAGEDAVAIERHIRSCETCRAYAADIRRNDALLRSVAQDSEPGDDFEERLFGPQERDARPSRRLIFAGMGAAAASLGGLGLLMRPSTGTDTADFRDAVLGDFATYIAADKPLDIANADAARVVPWMSARVPFVLPERVAPEGATLLGGRLCWLVGRRLAAINFEVDAAPVGLYIAGADGLSGLPNDGASPVNGARDGLRGTFWRERGLALGIVGALPASRLSGLAETLQG